MTQAPIIYASAPNSPEIYEIKNPSPNVVKGWIQILFRKVVTA